MDIAWPVTRVATATGILSADPSRAYPQSPPLPVTPFVAMCRAMVWAGISIQSPVTNDRTPLLHHAADIQEVLYCQDSTNCCLAVCPSIPSQTKPNTRACSPESVSADAKTGLGAWRCPLLIPFRLVGSPRAGCGAARGKPLQAKDHLASQCVQLVGRQPSSSSLPTSLPRAPRVMSFLHALPNTLLQHCHSV